MTFKTENAELKITINRSDRRTLSIELKADEIIVRAPVDFDEKEIYKIIESKRSWIKKHLAVLTKRQESVDKAEPFTEEEIQELCEKTKAIVTERAAYYAPLIGITYNRITIRRQRTRLGSCSGKGNLNFNCILALFPLDVIDSVVVHELCHRKHMNHSPQFYAEIEKVFPDYERCNNWLREAAAVPLARLGK